VKAQPREMLSLLRDDRPFVVPIFQRRYAWRVADVAELLDDVITSGMNAALARHFTGTVVHVRHRDASGASATQRQLIDGQQRLTTLTLLLTTLARAIQMQPEGLDVTREAIEHNYLFRPDEMGEQRYRLLLTQADRATLAALIEGSYLPRDAAAPLKDAYEYLSQRLLESGVDLRIVWNGIKKLMVVEVELEASEDDPQVVFESLNSKGRELAQADLVRNYVLMQFPVATQEAMFAGFWRPLQEALDARASSRDGLDAMLRQYATLRTGRAIGTRSTYTELKRVHLTSGRNAFELLTDLRKHGLIFARIVRPVEKDLAVREALESFNRLDVDAARPLLMKLVCAWDDGALQTDELLGAVRALQAFVFRRRVCGLPTQSFNQLVARLAFELPVSGSLARMLVHELANGRELDRFPSDFEFEQALRSRPLYLSRDLARFALAELENFDRKEPVSVAEFTIEHVLPQTENLSDAWTVMLGERWREVQATYLHTLGNLTLTGYNSELSARPFLEKRDMEGGFRDSPIRLNRYLAELERWDEAAIVARTAELVRLALRVWPLPAGAAADRPYATSDGREPTPRDWPGVHIDRNVSVHDALVEAVRSVLPDAIERRTKGGMLRLRVGGDDPAVHEFATIAPGDVPEMRVRLTADVLADPDRLFDWAPLGIGYHYPFTEAARVRVPSHEWIPKVLPAVVQAKEVRVLRLASEPTPRAQRLANLVAAVRDRLPDGVGVREPIRPTFAQIVVPSWPQELHYEITLRADGPAVMLHFELDPDAPGRDALRAAFDALTQPLSRHFGARLHHRPPSKYGSFEVRLADGVGSDVVLETLVELVALTRNEMQRAVEAVFGKATPVGS
jgi:hypothetical protein